MFVLSNVSIPLGLPEAQWKNTVLKKLGLSPDALADCAVCRRAVDARQKSDVHFVVSFRIGLRDPRWEERLLKTRADTAPYTETELVPPELDHAPSCRPVVVGAGPAGLFCAYLLALAGARPLLVERGRPVERRQEDVDAYFSGAPLQISSNVQFGEGGAGTFSDGKLNSGTHDPRSRLVLQTFVKMGAPPEIAVDAKPHIGTDNLRSVVRNLRRAILASGGEVRFETALTGLELSGGRICAARFGAESFPTHAVVLCCGHSARDTFVMLQALGVPLEPKPFSIGARIEHPQTLINQSQYGPAAGNPALGAADYKLSCHLPSGRSVYSFCMCPGGVVVAAASEEQSVVTNGMSYHARNAANANSALLVSVTPEDFPSSDPLAGVEFQRTYERLAYRAAGCTGKAPAEYLSTFLGTKNAGYTVQPSYPRGIAETDLAGALPPYAVQALREALPVFGRKIRFFDAGGALLTGVETRSSSPVRILRGENGQSDIAGLFPCGEGAGYAGGILSSAADGLRQAENVLKIL